MVKIDQERLRLARREYIGFFRDCRKVLDAGCGTGIFLELLRAEKITALGIDRNPERIELCRVRRMRK